MTVLAPSSTAHDFNHGRFQCELGAVCRSAAQKSPRAVKLAWKPLPGFSSKFVAEGYLRQPDHMGKPGCDMHCVVQGYDQLPPLDSPVLHVGSRRGNPRIHAMQRAKDVACEELQRHTYKTQAQEQRRCYEEEDRLASTWEERQERLVKGWDATARRSAVEVQKLRSKREAELYAMESMREQEQFAQRLRHNSEMKAGHRTDRFHEQLSWHLEEMEAEAAARQADEATFWNDRRMRRNARAARSHYRTRSLQAAALLSPRAMMIDFRV